ncbi:alpha/beta-hydrolase [Penicillium angulare]|uniref:Alpha/beta-hydrolase n=1 Tax=Penicillium angulare TaxID=116970 RepID=A0A9W9FIL6_9EURO|nr:alpha/beta-hydrolase [Penicillium angulare]
MAADDLYRRTPPCTQLSFLTNKLSSESAVRQISILVHGWGCQATHFIPLIASLSANGENAEHGFLYLAVDLAGHGESPTSILPGPEKGGTAELIVSLFYEVLYQQKCYYGINSTEAQKLSPIILHGHSMGTLTTLELLTAFEDRSPVRVSHLILLDGSWTGGLTAESLNSGDL